MTVSKRPWLCRGFDVSAFANHEPATCSVTAAYVHFQAVQRSTRYALSMWTKENGAQTTSTRGNTIATTIAYT
eukprot:407357-Pleurochrysis_carterae.AAC.7